MRIEDRYNINIRQYNMRFNGKSWRKAGDMTIYRYKNSRQVQETLKRYFIPSKIG